MKKLIKWIGTDGLLHILCCAVITLALGYLNPAIAIFAGIFAGFCKEVLWDGWLKKGAFSWHDIICDIAGVVMAAAIVIPATLL